MDWKTSTLLTELTSYSRLGLITDMDGTISPIAPQPNAASITPRSRELLSALQEHLALIAVVSGRAARDVQAMVDLPGVQIVGNHGLEWWRDGHFEMVPAVLPFRPALIAAAADIGSLVEPGMWVEDKGATLSIHYRQTADPPATARRLSDQLPAIIAARNLLMFQGNRIFDLRPPLGVDKGTALQQLVETHSLEAAVYLGDDTTDLDALREARHLRMLGLCHAVGLGVASAYMPSDLPVVADAMLDGISDVEAFLEWLLIAVSASSS